MVAVQVFCVPPYVGDVSRMLENMGVIRITVALRGWRYPEVDLTVEKGGGGDAGVYRVCRRLVMRMIP